MLVSKNFSDLVTFARASARWRFSSGGLLVQDAANVPSLDYDPITLAPRGLLVEEARTNLLLSSMYGGSVGVGPYYDITLVNSLIAGQQARKFVMKGAGGPNSPSTGGFQFTSTGAMCAWSIVEADPGSVAGAITRLVFYKTSGAPGVWGGINLDLTTGVATLASGSGTVTYGVTKLSNSGPNGGAVYLIWTATTNAGGETLNAYPYAITDGTASGTGKSVIVHHHQMEAGAYPSSVIVTTSAQATRAADNATITDLSKIGFSQGEGTAYAEFVVPRLAAGIVGDTMQGVLTITDAALNNYLSVGVGATGACSLYRKGAASPAALNGANSLVPGSVAKVAFCYGSAQNDAICLNGGAVASGSAGNPSGMTEMRLGRFAGNPGWLNGWLRNVRYFPRRFSNSELQALTA
ncbi:phage head spike fiber domain-containing protein [Cupriavidus sp.]|uniref:phage head spike fiber domain-containing protein n=1 Tax=Cupriavidus sp. TaxID=1873897 RepID=UPI003D148BCF